MPQWLEITRREAPLLLTIPHTGSEIPPDLEASFVSPWLARRDADWRVEDLYAFARDLDATIIRTRISRSVIDVNRDPSGASLYPGEATTELCPTTTFDGEPLYREEAAPDATEVARRRAAWHRPYHAAIESELSRLERSHAAIVLFDAHSIRSHIPRLFEGALPHLNLGTWDGRTCAPAVARRLEAIAAASEFSWVTDGRFKGGWTIRRWGAPAAGVHAVQLELAMRAYLDEPDHPTPGDWPPAFRAERAGPLQAVLRAMLQACLAFAKEAA